MILSRNAWDVGPGPLGICPRPTKKETSEVDAEGGDKRQRGESIQATNKNALLHV